MITFAYDCPHCGVKHGGFEIKTYYENDKFTNYSIFSLLATCNTCSSAIIGDLAVQDDSHSKQKLNKIRSLLTSKNNYNLQELSDGRWIQFYPNNTKTAEIPEYLPSSVEEELLTAEDLFLQVKAKPHFVKASGNAYRSTLERALCELAENDSRAKLNKRIEKLFEEGKLTKDLKNFALHIRTLSAEASHTYNDFTLDELEELRLFSQLFLQYTFTLPAMIPESSKDDIDKNKS
ncbi:DUF4145 domain-containing protein [Avibacterium paragallinarum]|uniref:DUF4145 domain-containing protein n=2 Tax=Avibacterium paragallinarum TaxID=728 RepID=A0A377I8X4_AVIPA|nr:DUF4145 domain-containing protein [Avibacterium paragallinarum]POY46465.1 DUF4145 domain-containing protein [Avibacterium paragallinarum]RZN55068.1 DUF4145 domain-containing protein [Avibacterium paragallinarum]CDF99131.1 Putative uncharacterized protein [Avibacterium paragallinarum JF4211]STO71818.1 Uncharacterised protein [Avibacterium paragallinarum]